jgi:hypothetical protein
MQASEAVNQLINIDPLLKINQNDIMVTELDDWGCLLDLTIASQLGTLRYFS